MLLVDLNPSGQSIQWNAGVAVILARPEHGVRWESQRGLAVSLAGNCEALRDGQVPSMSSTMQHT
jgi:hypothetical protein